MRGVVPVHWRFKEDPTLEMRPTEEQTLCHVPSSARNAEHSIVLRPVIRQKPGGRLRECTRCARIGKELGIP